MKLITVLTIAATFFPSALANAQVSTTRDRSRQITCANQCSASYIPFSLTFTECVDDCLSTTGISDVEVETTIDESNALKKSDLQGNDGSESDIAQVSTTRDRSRLITCVNQCRTRTAVEECIADCLRTTGISDVEVETTVDESNALRKSNLQGNGPESDNAQVSTTPNSIARVAFCVNQCGREAAYDACLRDCLGTTALSDLAKEAPSAADLSKSKVETTTDESDTDTLKKSNLRGNGSESVNVQVSVTRIRNDPAIVCVDRCRRSRAIEACVEDCLSSTATDNSILANEA